MAERKQEKDFSAEVKSLTSEAEDLSKNGKLPEAIEKITVLEKKTRNASDTASTSTLLVLLTRLCWETGDFDTLNTQLTVMSKKHGQLKDAVVRMVDQAMEWLPEMKRRRTAGDYKKAKDRWLELIQTLREITEGKIYLELPRARLTVMLAGYYEESAQSAPSEASTSSLPNGHGSEASSSKEPIKKEPVTSQDHIDAAADLMSELQVETYSSMDKREKTEFILEQMRLESLRGNWVRVRVGSRKVNRVFLKEPDSADLKLRYYDLLVQLALQDDAYLEVCSAYQEVWDTKEVKEDETRELNVIENIIVYVILAPHNNEQSDMLWKLYTNPALQKATVHLDLLRCFIMKELMRWPGIERLYGQVLRQSPVFAFDSTLGKKTGSKLEKPSSSDERPGEARWQALHRRVIEHNIRVVARYYSRIHLARLAELLDLPLLETERTLCQLVTDKTVFARINRPAGVVSFKQPKGVNEVLNVWSADIGKMLGLVEKTSHLVAKEYAMHDAARSKKGGAREVEGTA